MNPVDVSKKRQVNQGQLLVKTAYWAAAVRAQESKREDRLYNDPWTSLLAGDTGSSWIEQKPVESILPMVLWTRFFDDFLQLIAVEKGVRQFILMAAGLDTRAFRIIWPEGTCLFELDQPSILESKDRMLLAAGAEPTCKRSVVGIDLAADWESALLDAGFDSCQRSCWLL